ncbi:MAG: TraR/DksA family transcriptional regulator [Pseudobdellovibrionaceae bacterium]
MSMTLSQETIRTCRIKLLSMKQDLLNRARVSRMEFAQNDKSSGDEIDQTVAQLTENALLASQERIRIQLFEIEMALSRIQAGHFGLCEETGEQIEEQRLLAIPYTRLSIEGAEIRESLSKRFATP